VISELFKPLGVGAPWGFLFDGGLIRGGLTLPQVRGHHLVEPDVAASAVRVEVHSHSYSFLPKDEKAPAGLQRLKADFLGRAFILNLAMY
jgi:hypothetical protein